MADDLICDVEGMGDIMLLFDKANELSQTVALAYGLNRAGNVAADAMEIATPVREENPAGGNSLDRGVLKEAVSLKVEVNSDRSGGVAIVSWGKYGHVAAWVEYGHRLLGHGKLIMQKVLGKGFVDPKPFARDAAEVATGPIIQAFVDGFVDVLVSEGVVVKEDVA